MGTPLTSSMKQEDVLLGESLARLPETLLESANWAQINTTVEKEQRNRECCTPAISVYRWWARQPHAVVEALFDAAILSAGDEKALCS